MGSMVSLMAKIHVPVLHRNGHVSRSRRKARQQLTEPPPPSVSLVIARETPQSSTLPVQGSEVSRFLALPAELRLEIYNQSIEIFESCPCGSQPYCASSWCSIMRRNETHPLYHLLFVNQLLRREVSSVLYRRPSFKFDSPQRCLFFLRWTSSHAHLLRSLRIALPPHDTYSLESIFRLLLVKQANLEKLAIEFLDIASMANPTPLHKLLPKVPREEALRQARCRAQKLNKFFGKDLDPNDQQLFPQTKAPTSMPLDSCNTWMGRFKTLRYLSTKGTATGDWALEFELGMLRLHARMFELAASEGERVTLQDTGTRFYDFKRVEEDERGVWSHVRCAHRRYDDHDYWMNNAYWIGETKIEGEAELSHMRRYCLERPPPPERNRRNAPPAFEVA